MNKSFVDVASDEDCMVTTTGKDEYLQGYDDGMAKAERDAKFNSQALHIIYLACIAILFIIYIGSRFIRAIGEHDEQAIENKCADMCEPYRMESCGYKARTATCRTPEGYIVRNEEQGVNNDTQRND